MFDPAEIRSLMAEEIELVTQMCRARPRKLAPEIHNEDFNTTLIFMAGEVPDETEAT